jgi:16S rRNA processing protein RimM
VCSGDTGIDQSGARSIQPDIVALAIIVKEWGVRGEFKALPLSEKILALATGAELSLRNPDGALGTVKVTTVRKQGRHFIIAIEGCVDAVSASKLRGCSLCVPRDAVVLEENEFFHDQLIGVPVVTAAGEVLGVVHEIFETGSNDVYVVKTEDQEYLLPAIRDVVQEVDLKRRRIVIKSMPGLLD